MLEHVRECTTAKGMLHKITNLFQRHTLLYKFRARRKFYTIEMNRNKEILTNINRVQQPGTILKSMEVDIHGKGMTMAILNGLPSQYKILVTTLDAIEDGEDLFSMKIVKS